MDPGDLPPSAEPACARTLLLVDDEELIITSLRRLLRRDGYNVVTANSGLQGLEVLARTPVDVIVSDQRMPGMSGVEFLRQARQQHPHTVRMVLSGYTDLQSVTDAINEGAIYKFLTKPWDDEHLRAQIAEAFRYKHLTDENRRLHLALEQAHHDLLQAHERLHHLAQDQQRRLQHDEVVMGVSHEILDALPVAVLGCDEDGMVVLVNTRAQQVFADARPGMDLAEVAGLLGLADDLGAIGESGNTRVLAQGHDWAVRYSPLGRQSRSRGGLLTFVPVEKASWT
jgi:CheY-like chemotaxis protein